MGDTHVIRRTTHASARAIAEERGQAVMYWPFYPSGEAHTVYPPRKRPEDLAQGALPGEEGPTESPHG